MTQVWPMACKQTRGSNIREVSFVSRAVPFLPFLFPACWHGDVDTQETWGSDTPSRPARRRWPGSLSLPGLATPRLRGGPRGTQTPAGEAAALQRFSGHSRLSLTLTSTGSQCKSARRSAWDLAPRGPRPVGTPATLLLRPPSHAAGSVRVLGSGRRCRWR